LEGRNNQRQPGFTCGEQRKVARRFPIYESCLSNFEWLFEPVEACCYCMNLIVSPHKVTLTKAIEDHLVSRIEKIEHLDRFATSMRVILERDKTKVPERQFTCSIKVSLPGPDIFAEDVEADLYSAIDLVAKKVEQQLRKRHSKFKARNHKVVARRKKLLQEDGL